MGFEVLKTNARPRLQGARRGSRHSQGGVTELQDKEELSSQGSGMGA